MIFLSGVHGVGKSYFCDIVYEQLGIKSYSASSLITAKRNKTFSSDKLVPDIEDNQVLLLDAISDLRHEGTEFILDDHFCLLNEKGEITRIPSETYTALRPDTIVLLTENPEVIADRRVKRDGIHQSVEEIANFQHEERSYATEIATALHIPLIISEGSSDLERVLKMIKMGGY